MCIISIKVPIIRFSTKLRSAKIITIANSGSIAAIFTDKIQFTLNLANFLDLISEPSKPKNASKKVKPI